MTKCQSHHSLGSRLLGAFYGSMRKVVKEHNHLLSSTETFSPCTELSSSADEESETNKSLKMCFRGASISDQAYCTASNRDLTEQDTVFRFETSLSNNTVSYARMIPMKSRGNMPRRQPKTTPNALPRLFAIRQL